MNYTILFTWFRFGSWVFCKCWLGAWELGGRSRFKIEVSGLLSFNYTIEYKWVGDWGNIRAKYEWFITNIPSYKLEWVDRNSSLAATHKLEKERKSIIGVYSKFIHHQMDLWSTRARFRLYFFWLKDKIHNLNILRMESYVHQFIHNDKISNGVGIIQLLTII